MSIDFSNLGVVIIGRNEGDRLRQCLLSLVDRVNNIVYVDSGSTDDSVELAKSLGVEIVNLDLSIPFTAARARNEGFEKLISLKPDLEYVQFVDGDCEIVDGWLEAAIKELKNNFQVAVVCGRRKELYPEKTFYNRLCDLEWNTPIGETKACGGDSLMGVGVFRQLGGFNSSLIAGEEPELCFRMREKGWKILRIDEEMTLHDANMTKFSQWWKRNLRAGYAYAEGVWLHGDSQEKYYVKETKSNWFWGLAIPLSILATPLFVKTATQDNMAFWFSVGISLFFCLGYPILVYRIYQSLQQQGKSQEDARLYALFCVLGKFPQAFGQLKFYLGRLFNQKSQIIEYK